MQTTAEWANKIINNKELFIDWLKKQYIGEASAVLRIQNMILPKTNKSLEKSYLISIIKDESKHAKWIKELLKVKNVKVPKISKNINESRYWSVLKELKGQELSFEEICALSHYVEAMSLKRLSYIVNDVRFDSDIRYKFNLILLDEQRHSKIFAELAKETAINNMLYLHKKGKELIGLIDD